jgi:hypothetical protein
MGLGLGIDMEISLFPSSYPSRFEGLVCDVVTKFEQQQIEHIAGH